MQNEILKPVLATDETAIPRYDIVNPDGSVTQQNVELRLKNEVMQQGTPYDEESVLPATLREKLGLPNSATPANAFEAVVAKAGAKVSMNAPTSQDNIAAGYPIGTMWIRPSYTLYNLAYSKLAEDFTSYGCVVSKAGQLVTATGNGDDKVISATLEHGSETGWLYCVVTPDATAVSAKVIAGTEEIVLTVGEANVVKHKYSSTGVTFEATYATANEAKTGTIVIDNLTVIDESATLEQVETDFRDVTDNTVYDFVSKHALFHRFIAGSASWKHVHDGKWTSFDAVLPQIIVTAPSGSTVTCVKGDTILIANESLETWTFNVPEYGKWVVTRTISGEVATEIVIVDTVKQYNLDMYPQLVHNLTCYCKGYENTDETGGLSYFKYDLDNRTGTAVFNDKGSYKEIGINGFGGICVCPTNSVDLSKYNKIVALRQITWEMIESFGYATDKNYGTVVATWYEANLDSTPLDFVEANFTADANGYPFYRVANHWSSTHITNLHALFLIEPIDNWNELCYIAGVSGMTSIEDVISSSTACEAILGSREATIYMTKCCTGDFLYAAIRSETFLNALNACEYSGIVYANVIWSRFLSMVA